jgi:hypothetical protein
MIVGRVLGWILFLCGLTLLGRDVLGWLDTHRLQAESFGRLWSDLDSKGLSAFRHRVPERAWELAIAPSLDLWAWPALLILGFVLITLCRSRATHVRRRRR